MSQWNAGMPYGQMQGAPGNPTPQGMPMYPPNGQMHGGQMYPQQGNFPAQPQGPAYAYQTGNNAPPMMHSGMGQPVYGQYPVQQSQVGYAPQGMYPHPSAAHSGPQPLKGSVPAQFTVRLLPLQYHIIVLRVCIKVSANLTSLL